MAKPLSATATGIFYCALSAVGYTAFYAFQTPPSQRNPPEWLGFLLAITGTILLGAYLAVRTAQGANVWPSMRNAIALMALGLIGQTIGILTLIAIPLVGSGITVVIQMGVLLSASAILGLIILGERVSLLQILAIVIITASIVAFTKGAAEHQNAKAAAAPQQPATSPAVAAATPVIPQGSVAKIILGIMAAVGSGIAAAMLTVGIRRMVTGTVSEPTLVFFLSVMCLPLLPLCIVKYGAPALMETSWTDFGLIAATGVANIFALLMITKALKYMNVVGANVLQTGLLSVMQITVGVLLFEEGFNSYVALGVVLSLVGVVMISVAAPHPAVAEPTEVAPQAGFDVIPQPHE